LFFATPQPKGRFVMTKIIATHSAFAQFLRRRAVVRQVSVELGGMTDRQLNDLGISRAAIPRLAREAASEVL
jgi:uncharacterized protein YjiS (DUF1127 family)